MRLIPAIFTRMPIVGPPLAGGHCIASLGGAVAPQPARHSHALRAMTVVALNAILQVLSGDADVLGTVVTS
jgi:hypothetical protein